jgi:hypothetical protein
MGQRVFADAPRPAGVRGGAYVPAQDQRERAWIHGTAHDGTAEGFTVMSTANSLPRGKPRRDGTVPEAKTKKNGVEIYQGQVFIKGSRGPGGNIPYDGVMWRDGFVKLGSRRVPSFTKSKPRVKLPQLAITREWTSADGRKLQATLIDSKQDKAQFKKPGGKEFVLDLSALSEADQSFLKEAVTKHLKEVEQFKKDYPWVKFE